MPSPVVEDQTATIALLGDPATHGGWPVERIETHASVVFLAGDRAFKLKRAVRFPFLDYGTAERRRRACLDEVALNRRTAPMLYLGVAPIVCREGALVLGPIGAEPDGAVDWVVVMRRFDQATLFDRLAERGALSVALVARVADEIARFHAAAERRIGAASVATLAWVIADNETELGADPALPRPEVTRLTELCRAMLDRYRTPLEERASAGFVRVCHGDLHLRNLCLVDGAPTLFDAIEFDERFSVIDVAYDFSFLLMDLEHRGLRAHANVALDRWLGASDDLESLAFLPLFQALRAAVRAKIGAAAARMAGGGLDEARRYLALAFGFLEPSPPWLVAIGGLSGTGKSTLGRALAPSLGRAPGALALRSDVERKRLFGVAETEQLPAAAYAPEANARVFAALRDRARRALAAGHAAVVDAVHARVEERDAIEAVASAAGAPFVGLWLEAPEGTLLSRVAERQADASDADAAVVRAQLGYDLGVIRWRRIDAGGGPERTLAAARAALRAMDRRTEG